MTYNLTTKTFCMMQINVVQMKF